MLLQVFNFTYWDILFFMVYLRDIKDKLGSLQEQASGKVLVFFPLQISFHLKTLFPLILSFFEALFPNSGNPQISSVAPYLCSHTCLFYPERVGLRGSLVSWWMKCDKGGSKPRRDLPPRDPICCLPKGRRVGSKRALAAAVHTWSH